jgi:AcrR family transcriptional regulator
VFFRSPVRNPAFSTWGDAEIVTKGELTRQKIIAQAAPIFNQRGFSGCSMQDILEATGLEKGGLYRHFSGKEELAVAAFGYALSKSVRIRGAGMEEISGAIEKLRYAIRQFTDGPSPVPGGCPLMNTAIDADDGNPALRRLARQGIRDWKSRLSRIVRDGIRRGEIDREVDPRRMANTIIATLEGALMISRLEGNKTAQRDARASLEMLLDNIKPEVSPALSGRPRRPHV